MICDVQDGCPKVGNCKCACTSHPITDSLIIDCSNQSCKDLPDVVPDTRHRIVLFMEGNQIHSVSSKYYFKDVKSKDLARNPVQSFDESVKNFTNNAEIIITDHLLDTLPRQVQLLDPNVFRFGQNGIPCNCDNRWIGEWRKFKEARYPLFCSNFENVFIEDFISHSTDCDLKQDTTLAVYSLIPLTIFIVLIWKVRHLRYDIKVIKSQFLPIDKNIQRSWQTDVNISFDEDNIDVRWFVFQISDKFCRRKELSTYIACRDSWPGSTDEQNIVMNLQSCKYCLIIQSSDMYDLNKTNSCSTRMEYRLAWNLFIDKRLCKVRVINLQE
ncbi:SLIT2 [Mytilus coruscus]|uniref:SLIT2 n=1 Tax=Mytilus coruscus TaxID=42192 RepID=A0A6J8E944_MYTCO|nr:SLIT2 [Mytilus coruscus]